MSIAIPDFLSHLRTDRRGLPVPYVNRWGAESVDRLEIRFDPHVGQIALFDNDQDELEPDFTAQNMQRQREVMALGLCQVCRRHIPWSRRFVVVSSMSAEEILLHGRRVVVVTEPWLDERCARFAIEKCPGLIRRTRGDDLELVRVRRQRDAQLVVSRGWAEGHLEGESREVMPAMWAKLLLSNVRILKAASA